MNNNADRTLTGLINNGGDTLTLTGSGVFLNIDGGQIETLSDLVLAACMLQGDFTKIGAAALIFDSHLKAYSGTATIDAGTLSVIERESIDTDANITINNGAVFSTGGGSTEQSKYMGTLLINSGGQALLGGANNDFTFLSVTNLSGSGIVSPGGNNDRARLFYIDQHVDTIFSGTINGRGAGNQKLRILIRGSGNLTLTGDVGESSCFKTTTTIQGGGGLFIQTSNTGFGDGSAGSSAITPGLVGVAIDVTNGVLGGTGTIKATGGDGVVIAQDGKLAPGSTAAGSIGCLTFDLDSGALDLDSIDSGALQFDLGAPATPGTTYDQIAITNGSVILDNLAFGDFSFTTQPGFTSGTYDLITAADGFENGLSTDCIGMLDHHYTGVLEMEGNTIKLNVYPSGSVMVID